jgi:hypothetical protein
MKSYIHQTGTRMQGYNSHKEHCFYEDTTKREMLLIIEQMSEMLKDNKTERHKMKPEPKINPKDIYIDPSGQYQKFERVLFYSSFYNEFCIMFHSGKTEYESTILNDWTKTDLEHCPGEQIKLF